jgi:hypothetical protein
LKISKKKYLILRKSLIIFYLKEFDVKIFQINFKLKLDNNKIKELNFIYKINIDILNIK